jgi:hypothetical protein
VLLHTSHGFMYDDGGCSLPEADPASAQDQSHKELMCVRNARCRWMENKCRPIQCTFQDKSHGKTGTCVEADPHVSNALQQCEDTKDMLRHVAPSVMACDWQDVSRRFMASRQIHDEL